MQTTVFSSLILALALLISSCTTQSANVTPTPTPKPTFSQNLLKAQAFDIDAATGGSVTGAQGTVITIPANAFVDAKGNPVIGTVSISLTEALNPIDMVLGNLFTTTNGHALESGGMMQVLASQHGNELALAANIGLGVEVPCDSLMPGMQLYSAEQDTNGNLNWIDPVPLDEQPAQEVEEVALLLGASTETDQSTNWTWRHPSFENGDSEKANEIAMQVRNLAWGVEGGLKIGKDSCAVFGADSVELLWNDSTTARWTKVEYTSPKGINTYQRDENVRYLFKMKKLGWANIDRLQRDPRTTDVVLITNVSNHSDFDKVYISIVTNGMRLPGYQKLNDSFSFTRGDYESPKLPVGATATIIATASKGDQTYFCAQTFTIVKSQEVNLTLAMASMKEIENTLTAML